MGVASDIISHKLPDPGSHDLSTTTFAVSLNLRHLNQAVDVSIETGLENSAFDWL